MVRFFLSLLCFGLLVVPVGLFAEPVLISEAIRVAAQSVEDEWHLEFEDDFGVINYQFVNLNPGHSLAVLRVLNQGLPYGVFGFADGRVKDFRVEVTDSSGKTVGQTVLRPGFKGVIVTPEFTDKYTLRVVYEVGEPVGSVALVLGLGTP